VSVSAEAPPAREPEDPQSAAAPEDAGSGPGPRPARPLVITGGIAACVAAATGLAVLTTLTAIGWITAPHVGIDAGLGGVLRTAGLLWLVAHHVGVTVRGAGRIGMLPLGLVLLPGALLAMAGRWVVHAGAVTRLRHVGYAVLALALPYTLLAGALAVASRTAQASGRRGAAAAGPAGVRSERDHLGRRLLARSRVRGRRRHRGRAHRLGARPASRLPDAGRPAVGRQVGRP
jgi:hypothetical protein